MVALQIVNKVDSVDLNMCPHWVEVTPVTPQCVPEELVSKGSLLVRSVRFKPPQQAAGGAEGPRGSRVGRAGVGRLVTDVNTGG